MDELTASGRNNLDKIGRIRRSRDFHLYTVNGKRFVDFYQAGGRAMLGHRPGKLTLSIKNVIERGLYAEYPSIESDRLKKKLSGLFPGYQKVFLFRDEYRAFRVFPSLSLWRPWHPENDMDSEGLILRLPLPGAFACAPALLRSSETEAVDDMLSPVTASGVLALIGLCQVDREKADSLFWNELPSPERYWRRKGPYMHFTGNEKTWQALFDRFLERGILLPPQFDIPAIIPLELTDNETRNFSSLLGKEVL
jgi:hypothetical protein